MPGMSGFEAFCEIRRRYPNAVEVAGSVLLGPIMMPIRGPRPMPLARLIFISKDASPMVVIEQLKPGAR